MGWVEVRHNPVRLGIDVCLDWRLVLCGRPTIGAAGGRVTGWAGVCLSRWFSRGLGGLGGGGDAWLPRWFSRGRGGLRGGLRGWLGGGYVAGAVPKVARQL